MKTTETETGSGLEYCSCSLSVEMRNSIGSVRCASCAKKLTQQQVTHRLVHHIGELNDQIFKLIEALQTVGVDCCQGCRQWSKDFLIVGDACWCEKCLKQHPDSALGDGFLDDYENEKKKIVRFLTGRGHTKFKGELLETYRDISNRP